MIDIDTIRDKYDRLLLLIKKKEVSFLDSIIIISCIITGIIFVLKVKLNLEEDNTFCPKLVLCAENSFQIAMLGISRFSAGVIYPLFFVIFLTKTSFARSFFSKSFYSELLDFSEFHQLHVAAGIVAFVAAITHSAAHIARLFNGNRENLITESNAGWSGVAGIVIMFVIVIPMKFKFIKSNVAYEIRKFLHYSAVPWLIILCFHAPLMTYIMLAILIFYCVDYFLSTVFLTFRIDSAKFEAVGNGVAIKFPLPSGINPNHAAGQYAYLNIPWISINEWHAFSLMINEEENTGAFLIMSSGDFTEKLLQTTIAYKERPVLWINGPHPSPFMHSVRFSKLILIASGAGITPAISVIDQYHSQRQLHLIFITSDVSLVKFFFPNLGKVRSTVFYTGPKEEFEELKKFFGDKFPSAEGYHVPGPIFNEGELKVQENTQEKVQSNEINSSENAVAIEMQDRITGVAAEQTFRPEENANIPIYPKDEEKSKEENPIRQLKSQPSTRFLISNHAEKWANLVQGRPDIRKEITAIVRYDSAMNMERVRSKIASREADQHRHNLPHRLSRDREESTLQLANDLSEWSVMYCGASKVLNKTIADLCQEVDVNYSSEYFTNW